MVPTWVSRIIIGIIRIIIGTLGNVAGTGQVPGRYRAMLECFLV